ncbi:hypothetical protein DRQ50_02050 [bacterium]|nr:MAG: hypothetical protein DRQ50_02050 [bacterium]
MNDAALHNTIRAFNARHFDKASDHAAEGLATAQGRDEAFWMGLHDACSGYADVHAGRYDHAESKLTGAMQKLRNFGFRYQNFEVTAALAGIRRAVEEIRAVRSGRRNFDVSLLPQLRLAAKADD